jgi:predicted nucleic acid-binding protein
MRARPDVWLTPFHVAEWTHAVEQHVFRKLLSRTEADRLHERFQQHRKSGLWLECPLPESAFDVCSQLARQYGARLGLRTLDTLHVSSALELKAQRFWTFDERQQKLARAAGLKAA